MIITVEKVCKKKIYHSDGSDSTESIDNCDCLQRCKNSGAEVILVIVMT